MAKIKEIKEIKKAVRYSEVEGSKAEMRKQFKDQLNDFEKQAKAGKTICLTDLLCNAEKIHLAEEEGF